MQEAKYTMGYSEAFLKMLDRRNAASHASFVLPLLEPGMRLLDAGCGPGTISMGLADAIKPGKLSGIDLEASQIDMAIEAASGSGTSNVEFTTGDATKLPFDEEEFDGVFCHTLLNHIPVTADALREFKRVLKPGGFVASRELIVDSCFNAPEPEMGRRIWDAFGDVLASNKGHRNMGFELRAHMVLAGFVDVVASASFEHFGRKEDTDWWSDFADGFLRDEEYRNTLVERGIADDSEIEAWIEYVNGIRDDPTTLAAMAWGEAIGRKPKA